MKDQQEFIPVSQPSITSLEIEYVNAAVKSTWISSAGEYLERFETDFSTYSDAKHGIAVSNGSVGLHLVLKALGIGPGDEVIVPDFTFIATANAVLHAGATPVFADIEDFSLCIDVSGLASLVTNRTKAIMPVHVYGHPADMVAINNIARQFGLLVIEDAAEAHGSRAYGSIVGGLGVAGVFSFFGNKNLTCGEGGMVTTNSDELAKKCRLLRDQAMLNDRKYWHTAAGYNYRLSNLHAAIGCAQLQRQEELLSKRKQLFQWYERNLSMVKNLKLNRTLPWADNTYWMICIELAGHNYEQRDLLIEHLRINGIDSRPYFYPCSRMPYLSEIENPVSYRVAQCGINLPTFFDLTQSQVDYICEVIRKYCKAYYGR